MNVAEFEKAVWDTDGIRIAIRAPGTAQVQDFDWRNAADQNMSVTEYIRVRIASRAGPYEAVVVSGNGSLSHGRTKIRTVRDSYNSA